VGDRGLHLDLDVIIGEPTVDLVGCDGAVDSCRRARAVGEFLGSRLY